MPVEIERKFLVKNSNYKKNVLPIIVKQGYLADGHKGVIRVRIFGEEAFLTVKGRTDNDGLARLEYEYAIPLNEAKEMLANLCLTPLIEKKRYIIATGNHKWEVDEFLGANLGLVVAEIELISKDESFIKPSWLGDELTGKPEYYNSNLIKNPYSKW